MEELKKIINTLFVSLFERKRYRIFWVEKPDHQKPIPIGTNTYTRSKFLSVFIAVHGHTEAPRSLVRMFSYSRQIALDLPVMQLVYRAEEIIYAPVQHLEITA